MKEIIPNERRIEKTIYKQFDLLIKGRKELRKDIANQTRWTIGLISTMTIAIILAVFFKG